MMTLRTTPAIDSALDNLRGPYTRTGLILWAVTDAIGRFAARPEELQRLLEQSGAPKTGGRKGGPGRGKTQKRTTGQASKKPKAKNRTSPQK